jgi:hypothetical protein
MVAGALTLSACGSGGSSPHPAPATSAGGPAATGSGSAGDAPAAARTTAPAPVLADGKHDAYLTRVDTAGRKVTFDKVEMLSGEAARKKYQAQNPGETGGPPNDYVLVNDNKLKRTLPVSDSVEVAVIDTASGDSADPVASSFGKLAAYLANKDNSTLFSLTVRTGRIVSLTSVYLP